MGNKKYYSIFIILLFCSFILSSSIINFQYNQGYNDTISKCQNIINEYKNLNLKDDFDLYNQKECLNIFNISIKKAEDSLNLSISNRSIFYFINPYQFGVIDAEKIINEELKNQFSIYYENDIKEKGNLTISNFIKSIEYEKNETIKCSLIADWICNNFTNIFNDKVWDYFYQDLYGSPSITHQYLCKNYPNESYGFNKIGRIRAKTIEEFSNNPYWCIFMNTGGCGEYSVIFNDTANRAGIQTRVVKTIKTVLKDPDHQWNEVFIDGKWLYVDLTIYEKRNINKSWMDDPIKYDENLNLKGIKLVNTTTKINRTLAYFPNN